MLQRWRCSNWEERGMPSISASTVATFVVWPSFPIWQRRVLSWLWLETSIKLWPVRSFSEYASLFISKQTWSIVQAPLLRIQPDIVHRRADLVLPRNVPATHRASKKQTTSTIVPCSTFRWIGRWTKSEATFKVKVSLAEQWTRNSSYMTIILNWGRPVQGYGLMERCKQLELMVRLQYISFIICNKEAPGTGDHFKHIRRRGNEFSISAWTCSWQN